MKHLLALILLFSCFINSSFASELENPIPLVPLTLEMADGSQLKTAELLGTPYILHFWATWCPYCKKLQPGLEKIHQKYKRHGLRVIGVSFREDDDATPQQSLINRGHHFKTAIKADLIAQQLGIKGTPTTLFINKQGQVVWLTNTSDPDDKKLHDNAAKLVSD